MERRCNKIPSLLKLSAADHHLKDKLQPNTNENVMDFEATECSIEYIQET